MPPCLCIYRAPPELHTSNKQKRNNGEEHGTQQQSGEPQGLGINRIDRHGEHIGPIYNDYKARAIRRKATADQTAGQRSQEGTKDNFGCNSGMSNISSCILSFAP